MEKIKFEYEFDIIEPNKISYETTGSEKLVIENEDGVTVLYLNEAACLSLAKILVKFGMGGHQDGFHSHFGENLDPDKKEILRIGLIR